LQEKPNVSLRAKMLAMSAIPVVVLVVAVAYAVAAEGLSTRTNAEVDRTNAVRRTLAEFREDLAVAESSVRGFLITHRPGMQTDYGDAVTAVRGHLGELDRLIPDGLQASRLQRLHELVDERLATFRAALVVGVSGGPDAQQRLETVLLHGQTITRALGELTEAMRATEEQTASDRLAARDAAARRAYLVQVVAMPAAVLAAIVLLIAFTAGIVRRIAAMRANAKLLDGGEPLETPDASRDELGSLSRALVRTGEHLSELQEELRQHATEDELTCLANRRGFFALGEHQLLVAARTRAAIALLFVDVDGLKAVNDSLGHSTGDLLLKEAAEVLRETIRVSDIAGRLGGDEFCVLLIGDPELDAERVVERIRETVMAHNALPGRTYQVSFSIGLSAIAPGRTVTLEELIDAADEAMYEDKRRKRGREPVVTT
jgi:diguanylate cyclase (GGDEF)-like protein